MVERITEDTGTSQEPSAVIQVTDDSGLDQGRNGEKWSDSDVFRR